MNKTLKVGVIGCGMISGIYLNNIKEKFADILEVVACADLLPAKAEECAKKYSIKALSVDELIKCKDVDIVLNLTIPAAHAEISMKALDAGKHVYSEKPLAIEFADGKKLIEKARKCGLYIGCAPDTFLGGGLQTCKTMLKESKIGNVVFANAFMVSRGPESFHPNPAFFYKKGAGPLFDMGPYYITALVYLLGNVKRVISTAKMSGAYRKKPSGEEFPCETPTHISAVLEFESGAVANLTVSWDLNFPYWQSGMPLIEIFGNNGAVICPDPNTFCGLTDQPMKEIGHFIKLRNGNEDFTEIPLTDESFITNSRGLGLADMGRAILGGYKHTVSGELALHTLEIMCAILNSTEEKRAIEITTKY